MEMLACIKSFGMPKQKIVGEDSVFELYLN